MWHVNRDDLEKLVAQSTSYRDLARRLGVRGPKAKSLVRDFGIDASHFRFGKVTSEYVGKTFGSLTVTSVYKISNGKWLADCVCSCGMVVTKRVDGVVSGRVPSCGCLSVNRPTVLGSLNASFRGQGEIRSTHFIKIQRGASNRGIPFEVSREFLWELYERQNRKCALSGTPIQFGRVYFCHETTASLDRIDSSLGYAIGNVQWVHKDVNKMKRDLDQTYFLEWCLRIANHLRDNP